MHVSDSVTCRTNPERLELGGGVRWGGVQGVGRGDAMVKF